MTDEDIKAAVIRVLQQIAPEADPSQLDPRVSLRDQLDIDSMDFLNFAIGLHREFHVDIPEAAYARLLTLNGCVEYLSQAQTKS
jgi:acyl carrier protein